MRIKLLVLVFFCVFVLGFSKPQEQYNSHQKTKHLPVQVEYSQYSSINLYKVGGAFSVLLFSYFVLLYFVYLVNKNIPNVDDKIRFRRYLYLCILFISVVCIALIFINDIRYLGVLLGILLILFLLLRNTIYNVVSYFIIVLRNFPKKGDRIQIGSIAGDVINITLDYIQLSEIVARSGIWVKTGRVIYFPIRKFLNSTVLSTADGMNMAWDYVEIIVSKKCDIKQFKYTLIDAINNMMSREYKRLSVIRRAKKMYINIRDIGPSAYYEIVKNGYRLVLRFVTFPNQELSTREKIEDIINRLNDKCIISYRFVSKF